MLIPTVPSSPVTPSPVSVTGVSLDQSTLTLNVGDDATLVATVTPSNADDPSVTWDTDDGDVATVDNTGKVLAIGAGTATITVKTTDGNFTATCEVTVS